MAKIANYAMNGISGAPTVVSDNAGILVRINVLVAGAAAGSANDTNVAANASIANQICAIPNVVGSYALDWPVSGGIVITPGAGQTLSVSYN